VDTASRTPPERRQRQDALQAEADQVVGELELASLLSAIGHPNRVGSSRLGLMTWRDIDLTVVCGDLAAASPSVLRAGALLSARPVVRELLLRKETGRFNRYPGRYPDGLYLRVAYAPSHRPEWNLDIWFVDEPDRQPDLADVRSMPARLTEESRDAILAIKTGWARRAEYGTSVTSHDIYTAVLDDGIADVDGFAAWLGRRAAAVD
jgi:hypothetical protein